MISIRLLMYCVLASGLYLLVLSFVLDFAERRLKLTAGVPEEMIESSGAAAVLVNFLMESLFYVVIPSIVYSFFYYVMPFSGVRAGLAAALFAFALGAAPALMGLSVRVKLPMPYLLFVMLSLLLKLGGCMAVIGFLYSL